MRLFIAEKPELARAIAEALGGGNRQDGYIECGDDIVTWCIGHLLTLTDPEDYDEDAKQWNLEKLPLQWPIGNKPQEGKEKQIKTIVKLIYEADEVVNAGDPDEEGQLIVDEMIEYANCTVPVKRVLINDNNKKVVVKALANLKDNSEFEGLSKSALARSVADQRYGYNLTRAYTLSGRKAGADGVLSVGRVQTPILGLVVNRCRANADHKSHSYQFISAELKTADNSFKVRYEPKESDPIDDKKRIIDSEFAANLKSNVEENGATITDVTVADKETPQVLPYNLLKLQADASKKYGLSPDKTLTITQSLREKHQLITYNRSDCQYLSDEQHADAPEIIQALLGNIPEFEDVLNSVDTGIKSRAFNSGNVSAHHAIVPTAASKDLSALTKDEKNVYLMIANAYIAQFFPPEKYKQMTVLVESSDYQFKGTYKYDVVLGWKSIFQEEKEDKDDESEDEDESTNDMSWLTADTEIKKVSVSVEDKKTKPPALYTMSSLLSDLSKVAKYVVDPRIKKILIEKDKQKKGENGGIGTPATRSSIIKALIDRGYITEEKKKVISTDLGNQFFDTLPKNATSPDMTALWHEQQEQIRKGELTVDEFLSGIEEYIESEINNIKTNGLDIEIKGIACPRCGNGILRQKKGAKGTFFGCSNYPDCRATFPDKKGKPDLEANKLSDHKCPNCEKPLIKRKGKNGVFWSCSGFPDCKSNFSDDKGKPVLDAKPTEAKISDEYKCPKCAKPLIRRKSAKGNYWYGCSGFPKCKETFFEKDGKPNFDKGN